MRRLLMATAALGLLASPAFAHCDSMDGPVVQDAQRALEAQDVTPVLKWVTAEDEDEIRSAFDMTLEVREETDAANQALEDGNVEPLAEELASAIRHGVEERFAVAYEKRQTAEDSVEQGREYVEAYVQFTHFAEQADHLADAGASH